MVADGLDGGMAAHAVAHGEDGRLHQEGVLVVTAYQAHVGARPPRERGRAAALGARSLTVLDDDLLVAGALDGLGRLAGTEQLLDVLPMYREAPHRRLTRMTASPTCTSSPSRRVTGWVIAWPLTRVPLVDPRSSSTSAGPCRVKRACVAET